MDDNSFNIRVPKRWVRVAMIVGVTALIVAPLTAIASHSFTDVPDSNTFHSDIEWMKASGVTKGCNPPANTQYCPDDNVSRGQMAAFMNRFAGYLGATDGTPAQADNAATADLADTVQNGAITQSKIASGAVGTDQIAPDALGVALAGVQFQNDGTVAAWFNRFGGEPTVANPSTGVYEITFPGLEGQLGANAIINATDWDAPVNHIRHFAAGSLDVVALRTYDLTGALSAGDASVVVLASNSVAASGANVQTTDSDG